MARMDLQQLGIVVDQWWVNAHQIEIEVRTDELRARLAEFADAVEQLDAAYAALPPGVRQLIDIDITVTTPGGMDNDD